MIILSSPMYEGDVFQDPKKVKQFIALKSQIPRATRLSLDGWHRFNSSENVRGTIGASSNDTLPVGVLLVRERLV